MPTDPGLDSPSSPVAKAHKDVTATSMIYLPHAPLMHMYVYVFICASAHRSKWHVEVTGQYQVLSSTAFHLIFRDRVSRALPKPEFTDSARLASSQGLRVRQGNMLLSIFEPLA